MTTKDITVDTIHGPAQLTLIPSGESVLGRRWNVYQGDTHLGSVLRHTHTPHTKIKGTRLRKDLAPRVAWAADPADISLAAPSSIWRHLDTRKEALARLVERHQEAATKAAADPYTTTLQHGDPEPEQAPRDRCCPWLTATGAEVYWNVLEHRWIQLIPTTGQPLLVGLDHWSQLSSLEFPVTRTRRPH